VSTGESGTEVTLENTLRHNLLLTGPVTAT
jgi:hypothetical protein